jgi:hypothetical protein
MHRTAVRTVSALAAALALGPVPAAATAPGSLDATQREQSVLKFVCANAPAIQCVDLDSGNFTFSASECPAAPPPQECVPDFIPDVEIRGILTVILDDPTPDQTGDINVRSTVLIEFQIGDTPYVVAETFTPGQKIADWFPLADEEGALKVNLSFRSANVPFGAIVPLYTRIREIATAELGVPATALTTLRAADPKTPELTVDASGPTDTLASVGRYRVVIKFANPAP